MRLDLTLPNLTLTAVMRRGTSKIWQAQDPGHRELTGPILYFVFVCTYMRKYSKF